MNMRRLITLISAVVAFLSWGTGQARAQDQPAVKTSPGDVLAQAAGKVTPADRKAAAARMAAARAAVASGASKAMVMPMPGGTPDYFGSANWAFSPPLRKFVDTLPGLTASGANNLGQYIPIAVADTNSFPGSDYYEIALVQYREQMHSDLPPVVGGKTDPNATGGTLLRGYVQETNGVPLDQPHYLGPLIVAQKDRPVRIKFTNRLPTGASGDLFIPVDTTVMGAGMGPVDMPGMPGMAEMYTQNRATLHLHGGRTPWISDGTPHQWTTPAGEATSYPKGVSAQNVPDMPDPGPGALTFYYSNQQSSRLMFYHDHAWGITRLNVYVGEAAGYLIQDQAEQDLIAAGLIPAEQIPLIIQDKSFVDAATVMATDPTWNWGSMPGMPMTGDLWYPHVYSPAQNPYDISGANPFGRWHYGPWFWPPTLNIPYQPVPNPYYDPINAPWEPPEMPGVPHPSMPGESFMDTAMVNGTVFPTLTVQPKAYRFRILNAANDRFVNLQLYVADPAIVTSDGRTLTEVKMVPASATAGFPADWPIDGREGGVPDPATAGPSFIQIGTEGGFLPAPAVVPNQPIAWNTDPTTFNFGNVSDHALLVGTAERADVIIDFSAYAGQTLILYNDAPAAFPALDARYDYYTGAPDLTPNGGHPGPQAGFGPNIRTIMQIKVAAAAPAPAFNLAALEAKFVSSATSTGVFAASQDPIIVGQAAYNATYNTTFPTTWPLWGYARIQDFSMTIKTLAGTTLTIPLQPKALHDEMGAAFDEYGRMSGKMGLEVPFTNPFAQTFVLQAYVDPSTELLTNCVTTGVPVASDGTQIWKITHNGVDTHTIHFHLFDVQMINRVGWDGAIRLPDANELGWKDTIRVSPLEDTIVAFRPVAPKQPFGLPDSIRPLNPMEPLGSTMGFSQLDPYTGNARTTVNVVTNFGWEYVWHCHILSHEEMDMMRPMQFNVAVTLPTAPVLAAMPTGTVINLTWTDATPPASSLGNPANEIGFRIERARTSGAFAVIGTALANATTYTDTTVVSGTTYRYRVVAYNAAGDATSNIARATAGLFVPTDPTSLIATLGGPPLQVGLTWTDSNGETGFRIERATGAGAFATLGTVGANVTTYTDTMVAPVTTYSYRVIAFNTVGDSLPSNTATVTTPAVPAAPTGLVATLSGPPLQVGLTWTDNSDNETGFRIERATGGGAFATLGTVGANVTTYTDTTAAPNTTYSYRVIALSAFSNSSPSNTATVRTVSPTAPSSLVAAASSSTTVSLTWSDNSNNESGFSIQRATNSRFTQGLTTFMVGANVTTYADTTALAQTRYYYRVQAFNAIGYSAYSNTDNVTTPGPPPAAPTNLTFVSSARKSITIQWTDNANNEQGFYVQRMGPSGVWSTTATLGANTTTFTNTGLTRNTSYSYRVQAYNADGTSAFSNVVSGNTLP